MNAALQGGGATETQIIEVIEGEFHAGVEAFVPAGVGSYPLLEHAGRGHLHHLRDILNQAQGLGRRLIRTHACFDGGTHPARLRNDDGSFHEPGFQALDLVLKLAGEHGVRLLLPVANNWKDYGGAPAIVRIFAPGRSDKDAFFDDPRCVAAQQAFIRHLVGRVNTCNGRRYGDDPSIFAWELCNEARIESTRGGRDPGHTLATWATSMRAAFREAGAQQLVGWGGSGHRRRHGEDMEAVLAAGAVDFATVHVYPFHTHKRIMAERRWSTRAALAVEAGAEILADRAQLARAYAMPLLMEEFGWKTGHHTLGEERLAVMRGLLRAAASLGVGTLPWMIAERGRQDYDGLLIRPQHEEMMALLTVA